MIDAAPWIQKQTLALLSQKGHAWLLQGPSGLGQYELATAMVSAWLCESDRALAQGACGQCGSCHALSVHTHADLLVLMPETILLALGWPLSEKAQSEIDNKTRKPSKEIRIDAMRDAIEFSQRTNARGKGKAVLVFPAERMNHVTANAL
ncbi:MAG: polymerase subunit delta, partial [Pseudomonadota bacterium]